MASFGIGALLVTAVFVLAIAVNAVVSSSAQHFRRSSCMCSSQLSGARNPNKTSNLHNP